MICLPRNERFENRRVYVMKKSSVKPVDSPICLPATLRAFAKKKNLNLKVKITKHSQLKMKSMSVGVNTKSVNRSRLELLTKSKNQKKALFHFSTLSDRFKKDRSIIRCSWEKEKEHSRKENKKQGFKMLSKNYGNILSRKCEGSSTKISRNDLRHKLNNKTILSPKTNKGLEYERVLSKPIRPKYSETCASISKTCFNNCVSKEESLSESDKGLTCGNLFMDCEILLQQNHPNSKLPVKKLIVNKSQEWHISGETQNKRGILALNEDKCPKDIEITVKSPTKSNSRLRNDVLELPYVIKSKNNTHISENQLDSSDNESSNQHPNRRLQGERMGNNEAVDNFNSTRPTTAIKQLQGPLKAFKASEMWEDILKSPDLWKVEDYSEDMELTNRKTIDYHGMLEHFVFEDMGLKTHLRKGGDTLNEKRFLEKLKRPDFRELLLKFYIPPAQVEVFYQSLTDNLTAQECLNKVCKAREWPNPNYIQLQQPEGFKFCCYLMEKRFIPLKPASNEALAKELAASECLDWLGIFQRKSEINSSYCEYTTDTYFS
uniref:Uncharacterized protein n=1 Tax=Cuerna arida TaxID=1464854 RepID=A0A1B6G196_9HEMI